jgi:hypothetical protein
MVSNRKILQDILKTLACMNYKENIKVENDSNL